MRRDRTTLLDMEEPDEAPDMQLLSGGAGARLLSVLGQLSRHLGPDSRFTVASNLLQNDLQQLRAQTSGGGGAALSSSPEYEGEDGDDDDTAPSPQLRLPSSSALQEPQVMQSMSSMLRLLSSDVGIEPMWARPDQQRRAVLSGATDELMTLFPMPDAPASNPASPTAVNSLPLVDWRDLNAMEEDFRLDAAAATPGEMGGAGRTRALTQRSCPICLEGLEEGHEAGVLQMPCARQHMFHRPCLLQWLAEQNSCPVCRHCLPTAEEEEQAPP